MIKYLITLTDSAWRLTPAESAAALGQQWPDAQVTTYPDGDVFFVLSLDGERVDGHIAPDGQSLWVEMGTLEQASQLAEWFRGLVPNGASLLLMDEGYEAHVEVSPGEPAASIAAAYLQRSGGQSGG